MPDIKKAVLIVGRFEGTHAGHFMLFQKAEKENPDCIVIVGIVEGKKSSKDVNKNPFTFEERKKYILSISKKLGIKPSIIKLETAYIPDIITMLKDKYNIEVVKLLCGSDRVLGYSKQGVEQLGVKIEAIGRDENDTNDKVASASGTKVREALKTKNFEAFKNLLPDAVDEKTAMNAFKMLRNAMKEKGIAIDEATLLSGIMTILNGIK
jgi:FAD synthase